MSRGFGWGKLVLVFVLLVFASACFGADGGRKPTPEERETLRKAFGMSKEDYKDKSHVRVIVNIFKGCTSLYVASSSDCDPSDLEELLKSCASVLGMKAESIETERGKRSSSASSFLVGGIRIGVLKRVYEFPTKALEENIRTRGFVPHIVFTIDTNIQTNLKGQGFAYGSLEGRFYGKDDFPPDGRVLIEESIPFREYAAVMCYLFVLPAISVLSIIIAIIFGCRKSISVERRHRLYHRIATWPMMFAVIAIALSLSRILSFLKEKDVTTPLVGITGVWLGGDINSSIKFLEILLLVPFLIPALVLIASIPLQRVLIGPPEEKPPARQLTKAEAGINGRRVLISFILVIPAIAVLTFLSLDIGPVSEGLRNVITVFATIIPFAVNWVIHRLMRGKRWPVIEPVDSDLLWKIRKIGVKFGLDIRDAKIVNGMGGVNDQTPVKIDKRTWTVYLNMKFMDKLSPDEVEFLVTRAFDIDVNPVPGSKLQAAFKILIFAAIPSFFLVLIIVQILTHAEDIWGAIVIPAYYVFGWTVLIIILLISLAILIGNYNKRQNGQSTYKALEITRNLKAALSFFVKVSRMSAGYFGDWVSDTKNAADKLGIPYGDETEEAKE